MKIHWIFLLNLLISTTVYGQIESEPNNQFDDADEIDLLGLTGTIQGRISSVGDVDFYKVEISRSGVFNIEVTNVPFNIDMRVTMYLPDQSEFWTWQNVNGGSVIFNQLTCSAGTYYFRLRDFSFGGQASGELYSLKISLDTSDIYECNNSFNDATLVTLDSTINAQINSVNDVDFYRVEIPRSGVFNVEVTNVPFNIDMRVTMYLPDQSEFWTWQNLDGGSVIFNQLVCSAGTYYFRLRDFSFVGQASGELYSLKISLDTSDIYECNYSFNNATPIALDSTINAQINSVNDIDFYKVEIPRSGVFNVEVANVPSNIDMRVTMYLTDQSEFWTWQNVDGGSVIFNQLVCSAGTYYFELKDFSFVGQASEELYSLKISLDTSDIYECNNSFNDATPLDSCSSIVYAAINSINDQDYFKLEVPANVDLQLAVTNVPSSVDIVVVLRNSLGSIVKEERGDFGFPVSLNYSTTDSDTYTIQIYDHRNDAYSSELYMFSYSFLPEITFLPNIEDLCIDDDPVQLSGGEPMGGAYSGPGVNSQTNQFDPSQAGVDTHIITYTYTDPTFACSDSAKITIVVHGLPSVSLELSKDEVLFDDDPFLLAGGIPSTGTYEGMGVDNNHFDPAKAGLGAHIITYTYTDPFGCTNMTTDTIIVTMFTNTIDLVDSGLLIYPNPSVSGHFYIQSIISEDYDYQVFDLQGRLVHTGKTLKQEINLSELNIGVYQLRLLNEQRNLYQKIMIIR